MRVILHSGGIVAFHFILTSVHPMSMQTALVISGESKPIQSRDFHAVTAHIQLECYHCHIRWKLLVTGIGAFIYHSFKSIPAAIGTVQAAKFS